jgi:hypothetical protein
MAVLVFKPSLYTVRVDSSAEACEPGKHAPGVPGVPGEVAVGGVAATGSIRMQLIVEVAV